MLECLEGHYFMLEPRQNYLVSCTIILNVVEKKMYNLKKDFSGIMKNGDAICYDDI